MIDLAARAIHRHAVVVEVEAKVFDLIALLLAERHRAVSKREIADALWAHRPVTDAALSQLLRKARRALGDDGAAQRVIRTVHGHGLQWVAAVVVADDAAMAAASAAQTGASPTGAATLEAHACSASARPGAAPSSPPASAASASNAAPAADPPRAPFRRRIAMAAALLALLVAGIGVMRWPAAWPTRADAAAPPRIAVLPVLDRTGEAELAWTQRGLMGLMTSLIEQQPDLDVVASSDVQTVVGDAVPTADPAAAHWARLQRGLGATHAVATELRRTGPIYELDLRLLDGHGRVHQDTLRGTSPAPLAADAVKRVQAWLKPRAAGYDPGLAADIHDPFIAEAYGRGLSAQLQGDHAGARKYFDICLDHDPALPWPRLQLAIAQGLTDEAAAGTENAERVAASARAAGHRVLLVQALQQLASAAYRRGDMDAAAHLLDEALAQAGADAGPRPRAIGLLIAYGSVEDDRGRYREARRHFNQALQLAREQQDRQAEGRVLVNLAGVENSEGDAEAASALLRAGLDAARSAGDRDLEGMTLANLGATEHNAGRSLTAIRLLKQGLSLARSRADRHLQVLTAVQLAWALAPFDRDADAHALAQAALAIGERDGNGFWQAEAHWALAQLATRRAEWPAALQHLDQAQALYETGGMLRNAVQVLADSVQTASRSGDLARAEHAATRFRQLLDAGEGGTSMDATRILVEAQLRHAQGDHAGAISALAQQVGTRAPNAQALLMQLGRWQLAAGQAAAALAEPAWAPWLQQSPEAIELRIAALRASGRDAAAEQAHLLALRSAPELDLEPGSLQFH